MMLPLPGDALKIVGADGGVLTGPTINGVEKFTQSRAS